MNKTLILGWGESGKSACALLHRHGEEVVCFDDNEGETVGDGIENRRGMSLDNALEDVNLVVVNPAVALTHPIIKGAKKKGIEIIGEIELGYRFCQGRVVAVTGTNGKTTTVSLIKSVMDEAGIKAYALGNIGTPFTSMADSLRGAVAVLEISSFQLETVKNFAPSIAVCLNVTPDHLERHKSFDEYVKTKAGLFENQTSSDVAVLNYDDPTVKAMGLHIKSDVFYFSAENKVKGAYLKDGELWFYDGKREVAVCKTEDVNLKGKHNLANVLAAIAVVMVYGVKPGCIAAALKKFTPPRYRMEFIGKKGKLSIYNDSKATNIDSTIRACEAMEGDTTLIVGGWDKKISYENFFMRLPSKIRHVICCGDNSDEIIRWAPEAPDFTIVKTATLERAVEISFGYDDVSNLLFSPSTSSFDRYTDYRQRGRHFDEIVKAFAND